jgi:hypothetical protein
MSQWTPELEQLISDLGYYVETQMKDLLDTRASAAASTARIMFRGVSTGHPLMKKTCKKAGFEFSGNWLGDLQKLADLAEKNNSAAADKIRKALPVATKLTADFKTHHLKSPKSMIKFSKQQKILY